MSKGDKNRVSDLKAYRASPLWDNMKNKKYNTYTEFSNDLDEVVDEYISDTLVDKYRPKRYLMLDDIRHPMHCHLHDEQKTLQQASGIPNESWDIVRSYDEFVGYIETYGVPHVISFDNDLDPLLEVSTYDDMQVTGIYDSNRLKQKTGVDCANWLVEYCTKIQSPIPRYYVHSANSLARPIIRKILNNAKTLIKH
jgi:hypothetical protein